MLQYALTIRQPWAWAILRAAKDIENRDWPTNLRGPFLIHAAKGMSREEYATFNDFYDALRRVHPRLPDCPSADQLQFGGIVGTADVADCVRKHPSPWFVGKYGFVLTNVRALPFRPLRGTLGFFNVQPGDE